MSLRVRVAGILAAGALTTAVAGAFTGALALAAPPAHATPAEDCEAVRARDHQSYLNMIAALPPGSPIPPEYINPCLTAPSTTTAPPALPGQAGQSGQAGPGLQVGANAPTLMPRYNGTDIVPVPGAAVPAAPGAPAGAENTPGRDVPTTSAGPVPTSIQSLPSETSTPTATSDRGPGPVPAANDIPVQPKSAPVAVSPTDPGDGRNRLLELALLGAAAFTAGGAGVRGRRTPFGARTPESVLSQAVAALAAPLMQYAPGGQSKITVTEPGGGHRTFFLIHDEKSVHEAEIPVTVPPGGHMAVNPDSSVTVYDADGNPISIVAAPWAYDADGNPVPTDYEVRGGHLIQRVYADEATAYPILADPTETQIGMVNTTGRSDGQTWTETLPGGQTATHTLINGEAVDTRITRDDGTWSDIRTNDDGHGNVNTWSDDNSGAASYNNTDAAADTSYTDTWTTDSPTTGAAPDAVSTANATNTQGSTAVANQDGTTSTANWAANDDGSYDSTITNPDQTNSYVHSGALDENNENNTTVSNPDRTQSLLTIDGELIQLNSDGSPESGVDPDGISGTRWDSDAGQWVHNPTAEESAGYAAFVDAYGITPATADEWREAAALGPYGESGDDSPSEDWSYLNSLKASATAIATFGAERPSPAGAGLIIVGTVGLLGVGLFQAYQQRDAAGKFSTGNTGDGSKEAEQAGLDQVSEEQGVDVLRDQVLAKVPGADNGRYYDGLFENEDGTYTGVEIKSGNAPYGGKQEAFDKTVSPDNPAVATLNGDTIRIIEVIVERVPRWTK